MAILCSTVNRSSTRLDARSTNSDELRELGMSNRMTRRNALLHNELSTSNQLG